MTAAPAALSAAALACLCAAGLSFPGNVGGLTVAEARGCIGGGIYGHCFEVKKSCVPQRKSCGTDYYSCRGLREEKVGNNHYHCADGTPAQYCSVNATIPCLVTYYCNWSTYYGTCYDDQRAPYESDGGRPGPHDDPC